MQHPPPPIAAAALSVVGGIGLPLPQPPQPQPLVQLPPPINAAPCSYWALYAGTLTRATIRKP